LGYFGVGRSAAKALVVAALLTASSIGNGWAADPDALWKIVHDRCVPGEREHGDPKPCALVYLAGGATQGYAALRDLNGVAQYLLIPTERITGIEDAALLQSEVPNFFAAAWDARKLVSTKLGRQLPRDAYGLVINSVQGRTQEQLHIHIDCIRTDVRDQIRAHAGEVGGAWAVFPIPLAGRSYEALRVSGKRLGSNDPFKLLASGVTGTSSDMGLHTLIVTRTFINGQPGFLLLDRRVTRKEGDRGNGTELLDRACGSATEQAP